MFQNNYVLKYIKIISFYFIKFILKYYFKINIFLKKLLNSDLTAKTERPLIYLYLG